MNNFSFLSLESLTRSFSSFSHCFVTDKQLQGSSSLLLHYSCFVTFFVVTLVVLDLVVLLALLLLALFFCCFCFARNSAVFTATSMFDRCTTKLICGRRKERKKERWNIMGERRENKGKGNEEGKTERMKGGDIVAANTPR